MSNFIYTTSNRIQGPLLLDADSLKNLDDIVIPIWKQLTAEVDERFREDLAKRIEEDDFATRLKKQLEDENPFDLQGVVIEETLPEEKREELKKKQDEALREFRESTRKSLEERMEALERQLTGYSIFNKYQKEFSLFLDLGNKKKIQVESFAKALSNVDLLNEVPRSFELSFSAGEHRFSMNLDKSSLSYRVSPEHHPTSRDLFAGLEQWAKSVSAPSWQKYWLEWSFFAILLWLLLVSISVLVVASSSDPSVELYRQQAYEILKDGVNLDNQSKAIETLLALTSRYRAPSLPPAQIPTWFWVLIGTSGIASILLNIKPKSVLGIGKGQELIGRWRLYIRIVFIIIPAFILVNILTPFLTSWILGT